MTSRPASILVIDLEPTPYKTDLWNGFADAAGAMISVIYTEQRNWAPDGGHQYMKWPEYRHGHVVLEGKGLLGQARSAVAVASRTLRGGATVIWIAGYDRLATIGAMLCAALTGKRFVLHADEFNNSMPRGRLPWLALGVRQVLRKLAFARADAVLVCGRRGVESALRAGCPKDKVLDFPYVIDAERMKIDAPADTPAPCREDLAAGRLILLFSGRMIPRKGLPTLLTALAKVGTLGEDWVLWVEGDGPELAAYRSLAAELGIDARCRFLGFCQYDLHSWLVRSSAIVVVPSLEDTWGIVVDEGMQLGKAVISSDATGSGYDRIEHGRNGYLFPAGDAEALAEQLRLLMRDETERIRVGTVAASSPRNRRPRDNVETLLKLVSSAS